MTNTAIIPNPESLAAYMAATPEERQAFVRQSYENIQRFRAEHPEVPFVYDLMDEWRAAFNAWKAEQSAPCVCSDGCDGVRGSASCVAGKG